MAKKVAARRTTRSVAKRTASRVTRQPPKPAPSIAAPVRIDVRAQLLADVRGFNAWRRANLGATVDLTGADLRGADLKDAFLVGARMDRCQLDDAALTGAVLSGASLVGASLKRADLRGACFGPMTLVESSLAMSPLGAALVSGATLREASLVAARAQDAVFREADLQDADMWDCDFTGADLARANLREARQGVAPPAADETEEVLARLAREPLDVREGLGLFAVLVFLSGDRGGAGNRVLVAIAEGLGLTTGDLQRLVPPGRIVLEAIRVTPPPSDWARRVYFALMCGLASTSASVVPTQLQVLGHFGAMYGMVNRAMARIIEQELGVALTVAD